MVKTYILKKYFLLAVFWITFALLCQLINKYDPKED